jgi:hypothetical protein
MGKVQIYLTIAKAIGGILVTLHASKASNIWQINSVALKKNDPAKPQF